MGDVFEDWYAILSVAYDASDKQIQKSFRVLSVLYHPDKNKTKEAAVMFEKISIAKKVLLDKEMRGEFDAQLKQKREKQRKDEEMDKKRKAMKDKLHSQEEEIRRKKQKEQDDRKKESMRFRSETLKELNQKTSNLSEFRDKFMVNTNITTTATATTSSSSSSSTIENNNIILIKWRSKLKYGEDALNDIFSTYGQIDSIVILGDDDNSTGDNMSSTNKSNAIIYFKMADTVISILKHTKEIKKKYKLKVERVPTPYSNSSYYNNYTFETTTSPSSPSSSAATESSTETTKSPNINSTKPTTTNDLSNFEEKESAILKRLRERSQRNKQNSNTNNNNNETPKTTTAATTETESLNSTTSQV
ncbi:hypothetical protein PPL_00196 [Heterostelium album PN500]|uniref:J domain-containing protein n=1 Tax=Heterostelium pallidum (strain ATCC 26659 / Pp 5 / PN500) TaxID=670386 RepID=D3AVT1_HETP5|nr:hypothetical protein PPL_00196 [Heterostelium album PN500]EFA86404.1 hypothetical protein PPL_00196 [Heterostelium album PN500]|eukprot:XP_020438509.1 hypothetical protein PPL_00196 [Heterostelium album PN500]